ncbi:hypothetical protein [Kutzneria kofuensis]|uniref:Transmembrane protein n=1 Tax=Kutzneria kofuensis TaxID=103725 RepID=A0A7W9KLW2_9PSEU|nr:hypothetical protein [Kutzneria kofuensis]MBB5894678.1 hypothetical protein [Kutzneria kofuensis]
MTDDLSDLQVEVPKAPRRAFRQIDPGARALVVAVCVMLMLVAALLPWVEGASGWQILFGLAPKGTVIGLVPILFVVCSTLFGVLISGAALVTRLWALAFASAAGCGFSLIIALLAVWSQQSTSSHEPGPGPGIGIILALLTLIVLTFQWVKLTLFSAPPSASRLGRS